MSGGRRKGREGMRYDETYKECRSITYKRGGSVQFTVSSSGGSVFPEQGSICFFNYGPGGTAF